jgi:hypothetical protein
LFGWYTTGQVLFFLIPYIFIKSTNLDYKFYQSEETVLLSLFILIISNIISYIIYKISLTNKRENIIKINTCINRIFIFIIYVFVLFSTIFCLLNIVDIGILNITNNMILRSRLSSLGPFAIILMFPIGVSTYYWIRIIDGEKSNFLKIKTYILTIIALIVAFFRGQRTDLILVGLLPLLYIFNKKRKIRYLLIGFMGLVVFSAVYAVMFKVNIKYSNVDFVDAIKRIIIGDIDRNWTYWMTIKHSKIFSNEIMSIPYSGYIYTLLTFIPRKIASFKGYSTESWFVFFMGNKYVYEWGVYSISDVNWGITLGSLTEALINGGYVAVIPFSIGIGSLLSVLENMTQKYKYLNCCIPLVVVLLSGYTFYNIIVIYIPIIFTLIIMNKKEIYKNSCDRRDVKYEKKGFNNYGSL